MNFDRRVYTDMSRHARNAVGKKCSFLRSAMQAKNYQSFYITSDLCQHKSCTAAREGSSDFFGSSALAQGGSWNISE